MVKAVMEQGLPAGLANDLPGNTVWFIIKKDSDGNEWLVFGRGFLDKQWSDRYGVGEITLEIKVPAEALLGRIPRPNNVPLTEECWYIVVHTFGLLINPRFASKA